MECENYVSRLPQDIAIDLRQALRALGVSRYCVVEKVLCAEMQDVAETPVITGPLFVDPASAPLLDQEDREANDAREVEALQRYLRRFC